MTCSLARDSPERRSEAIPLGANLPSRSPVSPASVRRRFFAVNLAPVKAALARAPNLGYTKASSRK
jgi:hypothetical protein